MPSTPGGAPSNLLEQAFATLFDGTPYRLIGTLGAGGMGEVFLAEHRALGHRVVIKVLREPYTDRDDLRDRLRVEGQALARLRHPHLVMVTDFGETRSGRPYIVMEHLDGLSLREDLRAREVIPPAEAAEIARQMLHGLHAAHQAGLIHRDIKPDNVFLCTTADRRPFVKVLDFGIVKIAQAGRDPRTPLPLVIPTAEGVTLGTPRFISPEQARGERDLDPRSDLYAVGLVLYGMLVGHGPFDHHEQIGALFRAQMTEPPKPASQAAPQPIPDALDKIVLRALRKPRNERHPDAMAFADDLGRFLAGLGEEAKRFGTTIPFPSGPPNPRSFAEATTAAMPVASQEPTATASPAWSTSAAAAPVASDAAVAAPSKIASTVTDVPNVPRAPMSAPPPASAPHSAAIPSRGVLPDTVQMFVLTPPPRPSSAPLAAPIVHAAPSPIVGMAAGSPAAHSGHAAPILASPRPPARASWKTPVLVAGVLVVLAALVAAWLALR